MQNMDKGSVLPVSKSSLQILVVDDSSLQRQVSSAAVFDAGYEAIEAANGLDAYKLLSKRRIVLVLSDLEMPQMDGIALLQRLRRHPVARIRKLPFVIISSAEPTRTAGLSDGRFRAECIIPKPVNRTLLVGLIHKLCSRS